MAVMSNTSYADPFAVAVKIAQAFAEPGKSQRVSDPSRLRDELLDNLVIRLQRA